MAADEYFLKISKNPLDSLSRHIAPQLVGDEWYWIRRAVLLLLVTQNDAHVRSRLHILLSGPPGTGKSIKGDTRILISMDGKIKSVMIKDLKNKNDYKALSVNPITLKTEWKKVHHFTKHIEKRKVLKIKTKGKQEVVATKDHSFLKYDFASQRLVPVRGDKLSVGDVLPFVSKFECENIKRRHHGFDHTFAFGFLVGLWVAEGCIQKNSIVRFSNGDRELLKIVGDEYNGHIYKYEKRTYDMHIFNKKLNKYLRNYLEKYPVKKASHHKKIPDFCFNTPSTFRRGLISGYFTGDGTVDNCEISMTTASECLAYGISHLLYSFSVSSHVRPKTRKTGKYFDIVIHSSSITEFIKQTYIQHEEKQKRLIKKGNKNRWQSLMNIPLNKDIVKKYSKGLQKRDSEARKHISKVINKNCKKGYIGKDTAHKTNKYLNSPELQKLIDADIHWTPISSIEEIESDRYVYDISVEDNENFVLENGMVVHNTEFLLWTRECLQGVLINAELTSKVGLVGDARGNMIKPGLLSDCDGNILLADELDKMPFKDQNGLLQAMEEGTYQITKGGHHEKYKAEVRVIGTTNSLDKIQRPLLDRFDFVFNVGTSTRQVRANNVGSIVNGFISSQNDKHGIFINEYLKWVGDYEVDITDKDRFMLRDVIKNYILNTNTDIKNVSYRSLEYSILRIAYATAKIGRTSIKREHVDTAIWLKDQILKNLVG